MFWKKATAALLACTVLTGTLAACGTSESASASVSESTASETSQSGDGEEITLRMAWWGSQLRNDITTQALELYTQQNPNVHFEVEFYEYSGYYEKMATLAAANNLPDIMQHSGYVDQYIDKGLLAPLNEYIDNGTLDVSNISPSVLSTYTRGDTVYGISVGSNTTCLLVDMAVLNQAGITEVPGQMTYSEFFDLAQTVYDKTGVQCCIPEAWATLTLMARDKGYSLYSEDKKTLGMPDEIVHTFFNIYADAHSQEWHLSPEVLLEKSRDNIETNPIVDGTSWVTDLYSNQIIAMEETAGRELTPVISLKLDDATHQSAFLQASQAFAIAENSQHKEEAAKVIDFLTNSIEANNILKGERGVPISSTVLEGIKENVEPGQQKVFDFISQVSEIATPYDQSAPTGASEVETLLNSICEQLDYQQITADQAAEQFIQGANEILARTSE